MLKILFKILLVLIRKFKVATKGRIIRKITLVLLLYCTLHPLAGLGLPNYYPIGEVTAARGTAHSAHLNLPLPGGGGCTGTSGGTAVHTGAGTVYVPISE